MFNSLAVVSRGETVWPAYVPNQMIFPALLILTVSLLLFGDWRVGILLIVVMSVRLLRLQNRRILLSTIVILLLYLLAARGFQITRAEHASIGDGKVTRLNFYPDDVQIRGNLLTGKATVNLCGHRRSVTFLANIATKQMKSRLQEQHQPIRMKVDGNVEPFTEPTNKNQFDTVKFYHAQRIFSQVTVDRIDQMTVLSSSSPTDWIHDLRARFNLYCQTLPRYLRLYALGLISGYRDAEFYQETPGVTQLGLLHLFSISGMHVVYFLGLLDRLLKGWCPNKMRLGTEAVWLIGYFIFAGATAGLLRAILSAELRIGSQLLDRSISSIDVWGLTLIINLFIYPATFVLLACQFSYALSFGLIAVKKSGPVMRTVWLNLLSLPIVLENIFEWHVLSLLTNILVLPFFSTVIMPLVILGTLLKPFSLILINCLETFLGAFNAILNWVSRLPGLIVFGKPGLIGALILFSLTVAIIIKKHVKLNLILLGVTYAVCFVSIHLPLSGEITMFDVGQGDSFLVRTPFNKSVNIIDTGGHLSFNTQKWQQRPVTYRAKYTSINYLKSIGISKIDHLCISHQDTDHCGDIPAYLQTMNVKRIIIPAGMERNGSFLQRLQTGHYGELIAVTDKTALADLPMDIYHPFEPGSGKNEDSMVLGGTFGALKWVFTGDLDRDNEVKVVDKYPNLRTDVIKVGHHGSKTASDPQFIKRLQPRVAWISAGRHNRYGHPNQETIQTLQAAGVKIINTQKAGMTRYVYRENQSGKMEQNTEQRKENPHGLLKL